ncbi:MAG: tail fiber protein [Acetobacteraceae bacterium]|nr:tail fiber protein [Acetobacteraceae bacterium]
MAEPYLGQIEIFAFGFAPRNWLLCAGQTLPINQYQALFSLIGTTYGGNGINTFQLPNLQSRIAIGQGSGAGLTPRVLGEVGGEENHTLLVTETPPHTHPINAAAKAVVANNVDAPGNTVVLAATTGKDKAGGTLTVNLYVTDQQPNQVMGPAIGMTGGQPHPNQMPYTVLNYCIATSGIFPSRN